MGKVTAKFHDLISSMALLPLARFQRLLRPSRRPFMQTYYEGMRFRRESALWDEERKRRWMLRRLRFAVRRAYQETTYYRNLLSRIGFDPCADFSFTDFARMPVLDRDDILRAKAELISNRIRPDQLRRDSTGGSTGVPTEVWLGPEEIGWKESAGDYFMERMNVPAGTRTGLLWGHHLDPVASDRLRDRINAFVTNIRWFDCFRLSSEVLDRYHREFERWRPACIVAYTSGLAALAEHVSEKGYRPNYPARCFVTGAEKLLPHHRQLIEDIFRRPVHERYGSRDVGYMGFQLYTAQSLDYEMDWANLLVEPETDDAESAILITKLHADGMPMLRYRIGDIGRFPEGSRAGHPAFKLREVMGRLADRIWLPDGRWVNGVQMPHMLKDYPVREFQFIQRPDYSIELRIVPKDGFGDDALHGVLTTLAANLRDLPVRVLLVTNIPRTPANKWRPVISEAGLRPYATGKAS